MKLLVYSQNTWQQLVLPESDSISIIMEFGVVDLENIPGSYTLPFSLPWCELNNNILQIHNKSIVQYPAQLYIAGILFAKGLLTITQDVIGEISATMSVDNGALIEKVKNRNLNTHDLGGDRTWAWQAEYTPDNSDFALYTTRNDYSYKDTFLDNGLDLYYTNQYLTAENRFQYLSEDVTGNYNVTPYPWLRYVLRQVMQENEYILRENLFDTDTELRTLNIWNNYNAVDAIFVNSNTFFLELNAFHLKNHVPQLTVGDLLMAIKRLFSLVYVVRDAEVSIHRMRDIIEGTVYDDYTDRVLSEILTDRILNDVDDYELSFALDTTDALSEEFADIYDLPVEDNNSSNPETDSNSSINSTPGTYTYLYGDCTLSTSTWQRSHEFWKCSAEFAVGTFTKKLTYHSRFELVPYHTSLGDNIFEWLYGGRPPLTAQNVKSIVAPVMPVLQETLVPHTRMKGRHFFNREENILTTLRVLFYRGMVDLELIGSPPDTMYPWATSDLLNVAGTATYDYRLRWIHEFDRGGDIFPGSRLYKGTLYHKFWEPCLQWYAKYGYTTYTCTLRMTAAEVKAFDPTRKIRIGNKLYLVNALSIQISPDDAITVEATMYEAPAVTPAP